MQTARACLVKSGEMRYGSGRWVRLQPETTREDVWTAAFVSESSKPNQLLATRAAQQQLAEPGWPLTSRERNTGQLGVSPSLDPFKEKKNHIVFLRLFWCRVLFCLNSENLNFVKVPAMRFGTRCVCLNLGEMVKKPKHVFFSPWTPNQLSEKLRYEWVDLVTRSLWPAAGSTVAQWYSDIFCPNSGTTSWCCSCIFYNPKRWSARFVCSLLFWI